jgi:hypothetical protein
MVSASSTRFRVCARLALCIVAAMVLTLIAPFALAQSTQPTTAPATTAPADPRAEAVAPFLDAATILVAHGDLSRVDLSAVETWTVNVANKFAPPTENKEQIAAAIHQAMLVAGQWVADGRKAGARDIYCLVSINDGGPALFVVPLPPGADPKPLTEMLQEKVGTEMTVVAAKGAVIYGPPRIVARYQDAEDFTSAPRPELSAAFAAAGDSDAQLAVIIPSAEVLEKYSAALPPPLASSPLLTDGPNWAALSLNTPPREGLQFVLWTKDNATAQSVLNLINMGWIWYAQMGTQQGVDVTPVVKALTPTIDGNRLVLSKDAATIARDLDSLVPVFHGFQAQGYRSQSEFNVRQLCQAVNSYANDNSGAAPANLQALTKYLGSEQGFASVTTNPLYPTAKPGYVYVKPLTDLAEIDNPDEQLLIYDAFGDQWPGTVVCGFADGHVGNITDEARFRALLKQAQTPPTTRATTKPASIEQ